MRRLTAYRERDIQIPSTVDLGKLTISEKFRVSTSINDLVLVLAFRFDYNYTKYAVIISKEDGEELNATNLANLGIATDEVIINVEMKKYIIWGLTFYLEQTIAQYVAAGLGMVIKSSTFDGSNIVTVLKADSYAPQKVITDIANVNTTYLNSVTASTEEITIYTNVPEKYDFFDLDIDDKTAIGISFDGFNPEKPDSIGLKTSNTFSIPDTPINARLHGFYGASLECYDPWYVNYIIDNDPLIHGGKIKITDVNDGRISCSITAKSTVWDKMKAMLWPDFMYELYNYLQKPESRIYSTFMALLIANQDISTRAFYGDLHGDSTIPLIERDVAYKSNALNELVYAISGTQGGLLTTSVKVVFDFIRFYFGIDFVTNSTVFDNVNAYFQNRYLKLNRAATETIYITYTRGFSNGSTDGVKMDKGKKTVYDFVKEFIIHSGCLVDVISETDVSLNRMDDLLLAPAVDFSGNIDKGSIKFLPFIDGVGQNNYIDFAEYSPKIPKGSLRINNVCLNKNVETAGETLELKEFAPPAYIDRDKYVLGLFDDGSWENFTFMQDSGYNADYHLLSYFNLAYELYVTKTLPIAKIMDIGYSLWAQMIERPKVYKLKKWLTSADIKNLKLYQRYWIQELQGTYMLKKVSGLNPEKSNDATEMEFILITHDKPSEL